MRLKSKPLVVVDADTMIYSTAAACEKRCIEVLHKSSGKSKIFDNRTSFKEHMKLKGKEITDEYLINDLQDPSPIEHVCYSIKVQANRILDNFEDCEVVFCAGDSNNFRMELPYPTKYKGNRDKTIRPVHLKEAHNYFNKKYGSIRAYGHETDDEVSILAYEGLALGREVYMISPDGDSRQFDGVKLGGYDDAPEDCKLISLMHEVLWVDKKLDTYGLPWTISQHEAGDATDGLNPTFLCKVRYGDKGYYNEVKDFKTPREFLVHSIQKYKLWYPEPFVYTDWQGNEVKADWKFMLELYWKGTTMKREREVIPDFWDYARKVEVDLDEFK